MSAAHFLIICPKFSVIQRELLYTVINYVEPSEAVLLVGDDSLSDESNEVIFRTVHRYIQQINQLQSND